jgi:hypothetical protein
VVPRIRQFETPLLDVAPAPDGLAIATASGIEVLDASLTTRATAAFATEHSSARIAVTDDGRVIAADSNGSPCRIEVGALGGACAAGFLVTDFVATPGGFAAWSLAEPELVIDHRGERHTFSLSARHDHGAIAWDGRIILAGHEELAGFAATGARGPVRAFGRIHDRPLALGGVLAARIDDAIVLLDPELDEVVRITAPLNASLLAAGDQLMWWNDELHAVDAQLRSRWSCPVGDFAPQAAGDFVVLASRRVTRIVDRDGNERASLSGERSPVGAFGDGVLLRVPRSNALLWWRPTGTAKLAHAATPLPRVVGLGLAVAAGDALYLWPLD